ncbi:hypothetical protein [Gloeomargarita sp.]
MNWEDDRLVAFLRQYAPCAPPPSPGLEARIMRATRCQPRPVWQWVPPVVAIASVSLGLGMASAHLWQPGPAQVAEIEVWVEAQWQSPKALLPPP